MSHESSRFGDIRSVLHDDPSARAWRALCALIERVPWDEYASRVSPYARDQLRRWPDALRVIPRRWLDHAIDGNPPPSLELVRVLDLHRTGLRDEDLEQVIALPALAFIKHIDLGSNWLTERGGAALARAAHLTNARSLTLDQNRLGDAGCAQLARAAALRGLRSLRLARNDVSDEGLSALLGSPTCAQLELLDVSSNWLSDGVGDAFSRAPLQHLGELFLGNNGVGDAGVRAITHTLEHLERLDLHRNRLSALSAQLIGWSGAESLLELDLRENQLGDQGLKFLADSPRLGALRALDLSDNGVRGDGLNALSDAPHLTSLMRLTLSHNSITGDLISLGDDGGLPGLRELDLSENPLGDNGARMLGAALSARSAPGLRALTLDACGISAGGLRLLLAQPALSSLERLSLRRNPLGDDGAHAIANTPNLNGLRALDLHGASIHSEGAAALAASPHLPEHLRAPWRRADEEP